MFSGLNAAKGLLPCVGLKGKVTLLYVSTVKVQIVNVFGKIWECFCSVTKLVLKTVNIDVKINDLFCSKSQK